MIKVRPKYTNNPVVGQIPGTGLLAGIGGDVTIEHTPRPAVTIPEATQEQYKILLDAGLYPAAIYEVKDKPQTEKKEKKEVIKDNEET